MLGKNNRKSTRAILGALRSDTAGNVYAMAAAALFPIAAIIGGGVDIGRAYMAKARLQQACDAGALAGRRSMTGATMSSADAAEARKFFDFNFPEGSFDSDPFVATDDGANPRFVNGPGDKTVNGHAETTLNTSIMRIFGYEKMTLVADCSSRLDVGNVDVMMVLDVTGSMLESVSDGGSRLSALKDSVEDFYNVLGPGDIAAGNQIRYGFVPYSSTVNVGKLLYDENPEWISGGKAGQTWDYQSRYPIYEVSNETVYYETVTNTNSNFYTSSSECDRFGNNLDVYLYKKSGSNYSYNYTWWPTSDGYSGTGQNVSKSGETGTHTFSKQSFNVVSNGYGTCSRKVTRKGSTIETTDGTLPGATFKRWEYAKMTYDVHNYVKSISTGIGARNPAEISNVTNIWNGCIEERSSNNAITSSTTSIPNDALDLQIDLLPTDAASRWGPWWRDVMYDRNSTTNGWEIQKSSGYAACPTASKRLTSYASYAEMKPYISGLAANGGTNHAIGMIWGARLLSAQGLFAATNANKTNISRHILFMTDGFIDIKPDNYDSYGLNRLDGRIGPTNSSENELENRQANRFKLMCASARAKGWTVWVIQFGVSNKSDLHPDLVSCATSDDHIAPASNKATLRTAFSDIAKTIGGLRLSK